MAAEHPIPKDTEELLRWVDTGWRELEAALDGIRDWERPVHGDWRLRDVLAHMAAWEARAAQHLRAFLGEGATPETFEDLDAFNARIVAERAGRSVPDLLRELKSAHQALVQAVSRLSTEQLSHNDHWPVFVTAANTYGHYQEHARELGLDPGHPRELGADPGHPDEPAADPGHPDEPAADPGHPEELGG